MTSENQRIAIAESCGWKNVRLKRVGGGAFYVRSNVMGTVPDRTGMRHCLVPDYLNDLNAMHEAEKSLSATQAADYARTLTSLAWKSDQPVFGPMTASAAQRAEAFLRTLGLWEEETK